MLSFFKAFLIASKTLHFLLPPPPVISNTLEAYSRDMMHNPWFNTGVVCVLALAVILQNRPWNAFAVGILFAIFLISLFSYYLSTEYWTCENRGYRFVTGWSLTEHGRAYVTKYEAENKAKPSCNTMIDENPEAEDRVWDLTWARAAYLLLGLIYVLCVALFGVFFVGLGHLFFASLLTGRH
jgi:hypothetical protein